MTRMFHARLNHRDVAPDLRHARLEGADLSWANPAHAYQDGAHMVDTKLREANLMSTKLGDAEFRE